MGKIDNWSSQAYFYKDRTGNILNGEFGLKRSLERFLIIGGVVLTVLGSGNAIRSSNEYENQQQIKENKKLNYEGGLSLLVGFLGFSGLVIGSCYRNGRCQFEKRGFVTD